jgi:hypothetical protein
MASLRKGRMVTRTYNPVGSCIYCLKVEPPLGAEHIIPYGLAGQDVLPKASCHRCGTITSKAELHCLRKIFMPVRFHTGAQSRKGLPATLPVTVEANGLTKLRELSATEHPGYLFSFAFEQPYILDGLEPLGVKRGGRISIRALNPDNDQRLNKLAGKVTLPAGFDAVTFARMIAKIGYAYAVAERGLSTFSPLVVDPILTEEPEDIWYVVGGRTTALPGPNMHRLELDEREIITPAFVRKKLLIASVQLFASYDMPAHQVIVGTLP